jgi:putative FmdB family regulatory protein
MPLYTYKCKNCGKVVEKFHKMSANGAEKCEDCGAETLRVFLPTGIIFKGSGFYSTDYKSGTSKANLNSGSPDGEKRGENREETRENREETREKREETREKREEKREGNQKEIREESREVKKEVQKAEQTASKPSEPKTQDKDKDTNKNKDKN